MRKTTDKKKTQNKDILISVAIQELYMKNFALLSKPKKSKPHRLPSMNLENDKNVINLIYDKQNFLHSQNQANNNYIKNKAQKYKQELTLAEKIKLIPQKPQPLDQNAWNDVKAAAIKKENIFTCCAICLQDFKLESQLLLNCKHAYHKSCFLNFEMHTNDKKCPLCRNLNYEYIEINEGADKFINNTAIKLQKRLRGALARIKFWKMVIDNKVKLRSERLNVKLLSYRMACLNQKMNKVAKLQHQVQLDDMKSTEKVLLNTKDLVTAYYTALKNKNNLLVIKPKKENWRDIKNVFSERGNSTCSICLTNITMRFSLLSCSHGFHTDCLIFFEKNSKRITVCPLCRVPYIKTTTNLDTL